MSALTQRQKLVVLAICSMSLLIVGLDVTIVNVALPSIGRQLHAQVSGLQWTIDAYTLVLASLLMLSGSTADRIGRKRTFITGLLLFVLGSGLCSAAPNLDLLVVFRMLQAVGGSMLNPVAMSIITNTFQEPRERAQAIGVWGAVIGISLALGPIVGGALVSSIGWRSIFWINIPIGLTAAALTLRFVPESRAPRPRRLDPVGQLLVIATLACLTYGIIEGPSAGWSSGLILGLFAVAAASLVGLLGYEQRRAEPLIELGFFRSVPFTAATVTAVATFGAFGGFLFLNTLILQETRGMDALHAGLTTLPLAAMAAVCAPLSGRIVGSRGARLPLLGAGIGISVGALLLTRITATTPIGLLIGSYAVFGIGFGLVNAPITNAAVSGMPRAQAGVAAGLASTSRQVGQSLGVAVIGAVATAGLGVSLGSTGGGLGRAAAALPVASHPAWWIIVGCGLVVVVLGLVTTTARATAGAARVLAASSPTEPEPTLAPAAVASR